MKPTQFKMFKQLLLLYFILQFGCSSQAIGIPSTADVASSAADVASSAADVASAADTSQSSSSTQSCYKYDMAEEGCTSDNNCEIDNMAFIFCPPNKFTSNLAVSCASADAANGNTNYIPISVKTANFWNVFYNILQKYFQNENVSLGMEFIGFPGHIYETSDGDASTQQSFNITANNFNTDSALDRYTELAYMDSWKAVTSKSAYTVCAIDKDQTQLRSNFATVIKNSSSTYYFYAYFFNLQSNYNSGLKNCSSYNGTMPFLSDLLTFSVHKIKEAMEMYGVEPPVYIWHNLGLSVLFDPNVYRTVTQSNQLSNNYFACMKPTQKTATATSYLGCYNSAPNLQQTMFAAPDMHIRYCSELCRGQNLTIAGLKNDYCFCIDDATLSTYGVESKEYCNISCAAGSHQSCGGPNSISIYDIRKMSSVKFTSCYDLYSQGFHFIFTASTVSPIMYISGTQQVCTLESMYDSSATACPKGYRQYENNCYKFVTTPATAFQAQQNCMQDNGDLTTLNDDEVTFIWTTIKRFPSLQYPEWHVGIYKQENNWTYISGQPINTRILKKVSGNSATGNCSAIRIAADMQENNQYNQYHYNITVEECSNREIPYICKTNPFYMGITSEPNCNGLSQLLENSMVVTSPLISVTSCQQICIGSRSRLSITHAVVNQTNCICCSVDELADYNCDLTPMTDTMTRCNGNMGQFCGGENEYSVYRLKNNKTYLYATNNYVGQCDQLRDNAVRVSGKFAYQAEANNNQMTVYEGFCDCKYISLF